MSRENSFYVIGNAGRDASDKMVGNLRIVSFSLCETTKIKGEDHSNWFDVVVFGNPDRPGSKYLCDDAARVKKGSACVIKGRIDLKEFTGKDGQKKMKGEITASLVGILEKAPKSGGNPVPSNNFNDFDPTEVPF